MFRLLRNRNFLLLWLGQLCSQSGDRLTQMVLVALVTTRSSGSPLSLAAVMAITSLPALLVNPFAGVYVDRWDRKQTMILCDLIRAATIAGFPWLIAHADGIPFYVGIFVVFAVGGFFVPARLALIPDLVPAASLAQANALFTSSGMIGSAVVLLVGALLVEWIGAVPSCWVNAATYGASAAFILPIVCLAHHRTHRTRSVKAVVREMAEGVQDLWRHEDTRRVAGLLGILTAGAGASLVVGIVLVQQALHSVTKDLGFLSLWLGIGMLTGSLAYSRWGTRRSRRKVLGAAFLGCATAIWLFIGGVIGLKSGMAASLAVWFLGFWIAPVGIVANILVHEGHASHLHGRIFSSLGVVVNVAFISSMLVAGWLVKQGGRGLLLGVIGGGFAFSGLRLLCYTGKKEKVR